MKRCAFLLLAFCLLAGCGSAPDPTAPGAAAGNDAADQVFPTGGDFAGAHILVSYEGAERAGASITRTKDEARAKAVELIARLQADPAIFEELARQESDGPSAERGGSLGSWKRGQMVPAFDQAVESMEIGAVTSEPVETPFGYHVIRRESTDLMHYGAHAILVGYAGAPRMPPTVTRTQDEARAIAEKLGGEANAENFDRLADEYNDVSEGSVFLGVFTEKQPMPDGLIELVRSLDFGEVGGPIELPFGYAIVRRQKVEQLAGAHILVSYRGSERASSTVTRTREEAEARVRELITQLEADPTLFDSLAREQSDGQSSATGGDLGVWFLGSMVPVFDNTVSELAIGEMTPAPVESPFGFHVIRRDPIPE